MDKQTYILISLSYLKFISTFFWTQHDAFQYIYESLNDLGYNCQKLDHFGL